MIRIPPACEASRLTWFGVCISNLAWMPGRPAAFCHFFEIFPIRGRTARGSALRIWWPWTGWRRLETVREVLGTETRDVQTFRRYYVSGLAQCDATQIAGHARGHWSVENSLHWQLDAAFLEGQSRLRRGCGAQNLSRLRRAAPNLLEANQSFRVKKLIRGRGIKTKRARAAWENEFLLAILTGGPGKHTSSA